MKMSQIITSCALSWALISFYSCQCESQLSHTQKYCIKVQPLHPANHKIADLNLFPWRGSESWNGLTRTGMATLLSTSTVKTQVQRIRFSLADDTLMMTCHFIFLMDYTAAITQVISSSVKGRFLDTFSLH